MKVAVCQFSGSTKTYHYLCTDSVKVGDHAVVNSNGYSVVKVVGLLATSKTAFKHLVISWNEEDIAERNRKIERLHELKESATIRMGQIKEEKLLQEAGETDSKMKAILDEMKALEEGL